VNPDDESAALELSDLNFESLSLRETIETYTDTGGVAGYSSGEMRLCRNWGSIGYPHVGYNVGGVVGRQSGYLAQCMNYGDVRGRKEVGGVVGQMEPHLTIKASSDLMARMTKALSSLNDLMGETLEDARDASHTLSARLSAVTRYSSGALDDFHAISSAAQDFIEKNSQAVQQIAGDAKDVKAALPGILKDFESASASASQALEAFRKASDALGGALDPGEGGSTAIRGLTLVTGTGGDLASDNSQPAAGEAVTLTVRAEPGYLLDALTAHDGVTGAPLDVQPGQDADQFTLLMPESASALIQAAFRPEADGRPVTITTSPGGKVSASPADTADPGTVITLSAAPAPGYQLESLQVTESGGAVLPIERQGENYVLTVPEDAAAPLSVRAAFAREASQGGSSGDALEEARRQSEALSAALDRCRSDLRGIQSALDDLDWSDAGALQTLLDQLSALLRDMQDAAGAAAGLLRALEDLAPVLEEAGEEAKGYLDEALSHLGQASGSLTDAVKRLRALVSTLTGKPEISFSEMDENLYPSMDSLYGNLKGVSDNLGAMAGEAADAGDAVIDDLKAVNDQFEIVTTLMIDLVDGVIDGDYSDLFEDASEEDTPENTEGKAAGCVNHGRVEGDLNVGGVAGAMAIEYDFDPEGDLTGGEGSLLHRTYVTQCVARDCRNFGEIVAKKNHAGGIVGSMELGSAIDCAGFGQVRSEDGGYVGGIAGKSASLIRGCWALCALEGEAHVGGIAGEGRRVIDCAALVEAKGEETTGAIAGSLDPDGEAVGNVYVQSPLGGVDGIGYQGAAEPVPYDTVALKPGAPAEFRHLGLTFVADGIHVRTVSFAYGGSLKDEDIPPVPEKAGYSGAWPDFDRENLTFSRTLEAVYTPLNATLASDAVRQADGLPLALVQGSFAPGVQVIAQRIPLPETLPSGARPVEALRVTLSGADGAQKEDRVLHVLAPQTKRAFVQQTLYWNTGSGWTPAAYEARGSYWVLPLPADAVELCAAEQTSPAVPILVCAAAAVLVLILLLVAVRAHKKRRLHREA
ncbi:MAG: InlB B-repeat-containing protein, partial [Candidatus Spyradocola sp.]